MSQRFDIDKNSCQLLSISLNAVTPMHWIRSHIRIFVANISSVSIMTLVMNDLCCVRVSVILVTHNAMPVKSSVYDFTFQIYFRSYRETEVEVPR